MRSVMKVLQVAGFSVSSSLQASFSIMRQSAFWPVAVVTSLYVGISLPLLYLFVMIQYGAITFPYWDHLPTATYIIKYFDGTLTLRDLIDTHNESRPLFPRLIFVGTAALTKWDIRAEYIYIYLTIYGVIVALCFALYRIAEGWSRIAVLTTILLIVILGCSPVAAMNHYWSLMLFGTLSSLGAIVAFLLVSLHPLSWGANVVAAICAWVGTYSLSEGLFIFPALLIVHQMIAPRHFVLTRLSVFWLVNLIICYVLYIYGSYIDPGKPPLISDFIAFVIVFLGSPLGSLLWYPEMGVVWLPETTIINFICGLFLLGLGGFTAWRGLGELVARRPETLIFYSFAAYAGASAVVIAWGRANGPYAIATANSSRYSIFAVFYLFALIFYYAPKFARGELRFNRWYQAGLLVFVAAAAVSYVRAVPVYASANADNAWLANAYSRHAEPTAVDSRVFPAPGYFNPIRADLLRLGIGPYRAIPETLAAIYNDAYVSAAPLTSGAVIRQIFRPSYSSVRAISFPVVTWAKVPSKYRVRWNAVGKTSGSKLGEGSFLTDGRADWETVTIKLNSLIEHGEIEVTLFVDANAVVENPIGLAFYKSSIDPLNVAIIDGKARDDGGKVGFTVHYDQ